MSENRPCHLCNRDVVDDNASVPATGFRIQQWPVMLWKISPTAPYFHNAHLLILADCACLAYGNLQEALVGRVPLMCCPEADVEITLKIADILKYNDIRSITVVRADDKCCAELTDMVARAVKMAHKSVHVRSTIAFIECEIVD